MPTTSIIPEVDIDCPLPEAALEYQRHGLTVVPIIPGIAQKKPYVKWSEAVRKESTREEIEQWWSTWPEANVGILTGWRSGVTVIDIDPKNGGSLEALQAKGPLPKTFTVRSGSGGLHLYFQYREGVRINGTNTKEKPLPDGIDWRGDGGLIAAPPTLHASGRRYEVIDNSPVAPMPDWLYHLIKRPERGASGEVWVTRAVARVVNGEDTRNNVGHWMMQQLHWNGLSISDATPFVEDYQRQVEGMGHDTYTLKEAYETLHSVYQQEMRPPASSQIGTMCVLSDLTEESLTDVGNADRFAAEYGHKLKHVTGWGWVAFDGQRWVKGAAKWAQEWAKQSLRDTLTQAQGLEDSRLERDVIGHVHRSMSAYGVKSLLTLASSDARMTANVDDFDTQPHLLNVQNGTLDLRDGSLREHRAADRITHLAPVEWNPEAEAPRFMRFLEEIFPEDAELVAYLQRFIGYTVTGETREEKWMYASGAGSNGKGVLIRALAFVLGDYAAPIAADVLTKSKHHDGGERATPALATLPGKRFVYAQEPTGDALDEGKLKDLVSPDEKYASPKHKDPFHFKPTFTLWLAANKRLKVDDTSNAVWRRTVPVDFSISFTGREDWTLEPTLQAEASGILTWIVAGAIRWYAEGLGPLPMAVAETKKEYRAEQDPASVFFTDVLVADASATLSLADATAAYRGWQRQNTWAKWIGDNPRAFAKLARDHGVSVVKSTGGRYVLQGYRSGGVEMVEMNPQSFDSTRIGKVWGITSTTSTAEEAVSW